MNAFAKVVSCSVEKDSRLPRDCLVQVVIKWETPGRLQSHVPEYDLNKGKERNEQSQSQSQPDSSTGPLPLCRQLAVLQAALL